MIIFKKLASKGFGKRHEKLLIWQACMGCFFCSPAVAAAFRSVNALSTSGWSET